MADAFRCDECGDYFDDDPYEEVFNRMMGQRGYEYLLRAELCEGCSDAFAGGKEEVEPDDE